MRRKYLKRIAFAILGAIPLLLIWGAVIEPRLVDVRAETAFVPNLPSAWENKRVALIADLQTGMWLGNGDTVKKIVNRIIAERPAAVLIAGDFVYKPTDEDELDDVEREDALDFMSEVNEAVALVRPLVEAGIPTFAVLGNHDYGMGYPNSVKNERLAAAVRQTLAQAGVRVLENETAALRLPEENKQPDNAATTTAADSTFYLVGIGSRYAGRDKTEIALAQIPENAPRLIFMHNPDSFASFPANAAPAAFAGHTHGGQIRVPFTDDWSWMSLLSDEKIHADGWIANFGQTGNRLYVNRGVGFSSFPVRINCRPELTFITLRGGNRSS
ncbi:MAG: metallophosphoesterase [Blastocatellia bacterium]|jgi:predicted MPP superfamily phosphohydrolase|nr:metallophosphoesterase [Blastocatellia bacterium]